MGRMAWLIIALAPGSLFAQAQVGTCSIFPARNIWNVPIDKLPVHPDSALFIATEGLSMPLHADFGTNGSIPFSSVPATQPKVAIRFTDGESDPGPYPIPPQAPVETGDAHLIVL